MQLSLISIKLAADNEIDLPELPSSDMLFNLHVLDVESDVNVAR